MRRREVLKSAAATAASLAAPAASRAAESKTLRLVPQANLANLDPIWTTQYVVRNASVLFFDTLYGVDSTLTPRPQMCEGHETSDDGLVWTFRLRPGLKWHDRETVTTRDVNASLNRWMVRDNAGQMIRARMDALEAIDDRTFRLRLKQKFNKLLYAFGKVGTPACFIMPERIARTDPFKQISEHVGSGPYRFRRDLWLPGASAVFEKFNGYIPRSEPPDWLAGGKRASFDRIEWRVIPDPATAAAALQSGEVDWWETPIPDLIPLLRRNRNVVVDIADPLGNIGDCRFNHLYPPFNDQRVRQAIFTAADQTDFMQAIVGSDPTLCQESASFFTPGTPLYTEAGGEILKRKDIVAGKKLLTEAGQSGARVVMIVATDVPFVKAQADVGADLMRKLGFNVDYVATDWGTLGARRASREPVDKGGWNVFFTWHAGVDCVNPAAQPAYYTSGERAWYGWPKSDHVQATIDTWFEAPDLAAEKSAMEALNRAEMEFATFLPTGFFKGYQAWRSNLQGFVRAPFPVVWGVTKT